MKNEQQIEKDYNGLVSYQLDGRLMLFAGLYSHALMYGALMGFEAVLGPKRSSEIEAEILADTRFKPKYKSLAVANNELSKEEHTCFYCERVPSMASIEIGQLKKVLTLARNTLADAGQCDNDNYPTFQAVCRALE